jgi:lipid II:glycine glycyltransferase (peptidoglycan interpeptide bridge formation enzyme)
MQVREILDGEKEKWNEFVASSATGDLLQSFEWGELKHRTSGWRPIRLVAEDEEGKIVGVISILKRALPHVNKSIFYAPRGPVCDFRDFSILDSLFDAVKTLAQRENAILLKIDPPVTIENVQLVSYLDEKGFQRVVDVHGFGGEQPRCVMQLDLTPSIEQIFANFKPKWRYNIRLAEKKGVRVRSECSKDDLKTFYTLLKETAQRDRFLIRGYEYYDALWDILVEGGYGKLFLAEYEGEAIAGAMSFIFGDKCWYIYGASSNRHRNVMPNHLIQWRMIQWAKECGCRIYDFRGVSQRQSGEENDPLQGLNRFKQGFGARFVEYIGEFDLPLSLFWYKLWIVSKPRVMKLLKYFRRKQLASGLDSSFGGA